MGSYLEDYLESIAELPIDLKRKLDLILEQDRECVALMAKIEDHTRDYVMSVKKSLTDGSAPNDHLLKLLHEERDKCLKLAQEKMQNASTIYDVVDNHIKRLDVELNKFSAELAAAGAAPMTPAAAAAAAAAASTPVAVPGTPLDGTAKNKRKGKGDEKTSAAKRKEAGRPADAMRTQRIDEDMPVDPHEPLYCICNRVSFGQMVQCENPECEREWFHFECVGLTEEPTDDWYCPDCRIQMRRGRAMGRRSD